MGSDRPVRGNLTAPVGPDDNARPLANIRPRHLALLNRANG
jgi:hypothetical protein